MESAHTIRDANVRYHDLAAEHYDSKWGINYGDVGQAQVTGKLRKEIMVLKQQVNKLEEENRILRGIITKNFTSPPLKKET